MKFQASCEASAAAENLSDEVDEVQVCDDQALGEEKGYEADSESNPEDSAQLEEGSTMHMHTHCSLLFTHKQAHLLENKGYSENYVFYFFLGCNPQIQKIFWYI